MNTIGYFEIQSSTPSQTATFYNAIFGWTFELDESIPIEYYRIQTNSIHGGLLKRPAATPPMQFGTNAFVCSIEVDNFDAVADLILQHGGTIAMPKFAIPRKCWQGYFIDNDNNTFGIFQPDETAQ